MVAGRGIVRNYGRNNNSPATTRSNLSPPTLISWPRGRWRLQDQVLAMVRGQLADIILGAFFLFIGLAACSIAAIRRRRGVRVLVWFGMWSAMYGTAELTESPAVVAASPHWLQISIPYLDISIQYFIVVVAWLA